MKKIISFVFITLLLVGAVIFEQIYLNNTFNELIVRIDNLSQQVELNENIDTLQIKNSVDDLDMFWKNAEQVLCFTINYNDLNRIGEQVQRVKAYIEQNQKDDCVTEIEVLDFYATSFKTIFITNFSNIF